IMMFSRGIASALLQDLGGHAGADGAAAFADRKPQLLLHRDRRDQLDRHLRVVPRHHHLHPRRQLHRPRHVRRPQVKLRPIPLEKRRVPTPLLLRQHVHFALKLRVRRDAPRLRQHHPPLHLVLLHPPQQEADVVPRLPLVQQLPEHLHPGHHRLLVRPKPHHLHFLLHLHLPPLDPPRRHRPPARAREHLLHLPHPRLVPRDRLQGRPPDHRNVVPRVLVLRQQLPHLQLHQVQQLRAVHQVALVQEHDDRRHVHLPRQQNMLPRLRHRPVDGRDDQDRPVHLRCPRDHVLHVVGVPRAVHVRVVPVRRGVLHVRRRNRQDLRRIPPPLRFRRLRHLVVRHVGREPVVRRHLRQCRRQRRLPVVHVPNRPDVHVGLGALKLGFRHVPPKKSLRKTVEGLRRGEPLRNYVVPPRRPSTSLLNAFPSRLLSYPFTFDTISSALVFGTS